jgi:hypothetical protein
MVKVRWTCVAASQPWPPDWSALIVQSPVETKVTVVPETVQTDSVDEANDTDNPEDADADTVTDLVPNN